MIWYCLLLRAKGKIYHELQKYRNCWGCPVGRAIDYGSDGRGSIPGRVRHFPSAPQLPERLWGPPIGGSILGGIAAEA
jgi:hypothetical protein